MEIFQTLSWLSWYMKALRWRSQSAGVKWSTATYNEQRYIWPSCDLDRAHFRDETQHGHGEIQRIWCSAAAKLSSYPTASFQESLVDVYAAGCTAGEISTTKSVLLHRNDCLEALKWQFNMAKLTALILLELFNCKTWPQTVLSI